MGYVAIPRHIKLKYKLMQWFEDQSQCPLDVSDGFPAWVGWKSVTAASPAITTPQKGLAGWRSLRVEGFYPRLSSADYACVKTTDEIKARTPSKKVYIELGNTVSIDGLERFHDAHPIRCSMQDISLYRMNDGFVGVRFDFTDCTGANNLGGVVGHAPKTASLNFELVREASIANRTGYAFAGTEPRPHFSEFFLSVCSGGTPADFLTANLPNFQRTPVTPKPACFAESASIAHVIGKGCFEDFLFFDMETINDRLAPIPAMEYDQLVAMIPRVQHWNNPMPRPAPVPAPAPAMISVVVPNTPAPPPVSPCKKQVITVKGKPDHEEYVDDAGNPCEPQRATCAQWQCMPPFVQRPNPEKYFCNQTSGCTVKDRMTCCLTPTTTTTTPFVAEVPGVVVADRVCIQWVGFHGCDNDCACSDHPAQLLSAPYVTPRPYAQVCEDFWVEQLIIAIVGLIIAVCAIIFCVERCVVPGFRLAWETDETEGHELKEQKLRDVVTTFLGEGKAAMAREQGMEVTCVKHKQKMDTCPMIVTLCILCLVVAFCVVHGFYLVWHLFFKAIGIWEDGTLNSVDIILCPLSLFPTCIAIWLMTWLATCWYYAFEVRKRKRKNVSVPTLMQTKVAGGAGSFMSGFGGSMFGASRGGGWFGGWGGAEETVMYDGQTAQMSYVDGYRVTDITNLDD